MRRYMMSFNDLTNPPSPHATSPSLTDQASEREDLITTGSRFMRNAGSAVLQGRNEAMAAAKRNSEEPS